MPKKIDLSNVIPSDGDFAALPEGCYVCAVTALLDNPDKEYFELVFDIAEGPHAGYYSDQWGQEHAYAHRVIVSYKDTAKGLLKGRLLALTESNPGFDAEAAYYGWCDNPALAAMFTGKRFGLCMLWDYYTTKDGQTVPLKNPRPDWMNAKMVPVQKVHDGTAELPKRQERNTPPAAGAPAPAASPAAAPADPYDGEVPF